MHNANLLQCGGGGSSRFGSSSLLFHSVPCDSVNQGQTIIVALNGGRDNVQVLDTKFRNGGNGGLSELV